LKISKSPNRLNFEGTQLGILIKKQLQVFSIKNKKEKKKHVRLLFTYLIFSKNQDFSRILKLFLAIKFILLS
jgi:hypothetical protein